METCAHCHKIRNDKKNWKRVTARYHEVEIRHIVCPECNALPFHRFHRFYRLYEDPSYKSSYNTRAYDKPVLHFLQNNQGL
jgi:hypothetical protein